MLLADAALFKDPVDGYKVRVAWLPKLLKVKGLVHGKLCQGLNHAATKMCILYI